MKEDDMWFPWKADKKKERIFETENGDSCKEHGHIRSRWVHGGNRGINNKGTAADDVNHRTSRSGNQGSRREDTGSHPPGTRPQRYMFPKRNRLIAALSDRLYVIEAGRNSGTNTTVEDAERYGREVVRV